ncbi:MAG: 23S rRNA (uracil(1939)-C(5))-methyltransferase RlmD [Lysobacterales bacterium]
MGRRRKRLPVEPVRAEITDLSHDGKGVAHVDGKAVFVHGALPGEEVMFRLTGRRKAFDTGAVVEVLRRSPDRVQPQCPHFDACGGCALQHLNAQAQRNAKQHVLEENLQRIGSVSPQSWLPPLSADPWGYRRKARLSVRNVPGKGRVLVGFRERAGRYVCDMLECHTLIPAVGKHLTTLSEFIGKLSIPDEIPQIEVAAGDDALVLVIRHLEPLTSEDHSLLESLGEKLQASIWLQSGGPDTVTPLVEDATQTPLTFKLTQNNPRGEALEFSFSPLNFVQVNATMNQLMVSQTLAALDLQPHHRVLDLFCGLGNFTLPIAMSCEQAVGVEGEQSLVDLATQNAQSNGISNAAFHLADLREEQTEAAWNQHPFDRILLDPPRSGAAELIPLLSTLAVPRLVYVSCHPGSLARDAGALVAAGYELTQAGIMDMFPHTAHVESIAVFERQ